MQKKMPETEYRASRICRILGNPTAYKIIKVLSKSKKSPSELAEEIGLSLPLVSFTLRTLRNIDLVRYDTKGNNKVYWLKNKSVSDICRALENLVSLMRQKNW